LAEYADAIAMVKGHDFDGKPDMLIKKALAMNPNHEMSLQLAANSAFKKQDYQQAVSYWTHLLTVLPNDSALAEEVNALIREASQLAGNNSRPIKKADKQVSEVVEISGVIKLAPHMANNVSPNDTLFIFAKTTSGPPMPVAAVKVSAVTFPYVYHLNDSNALNPKHRLSLAKEVIVVARVSKDGDATAKAGDIQGESQPIIVGQVLQDIEINQLVN